MKRVLILTAILTIALSSPVYADYSPESKRLGEEAGLAMEYDLDEIMARQDALKQQKANKSTLVSENALKTPNKSLKSRNDEYRIVSGGGKNSVKVTDTEDELHIYSNTYSNPTNYGAKYSTDEFRVYGMDTPANDGHDESTWGELHINRNYRKNVFYEPEKESKRIQGFDELRYVWELN